MSEKQELDNLGSMPLGAPDGGKSYSEACARLEKMKCVSVCITVLNRYDLLHGCLKSLSASNVRPSKIYVIDNGNNDDAMRKAVTGTGVEDLVSVFCPVPSYGLAKAWNWFLRRTAGEGARVISNDDITFGEKSLEIMLSSPGDLVFPAGVGFSCFLIRDRCVSTLGTFDESLSPGFAYFEDCDYQFRKDRYNESVAVLGADCMLLTPWQDGEPVVTCDVADHGIAHLGQGTQRGISRSPEEVKRFRGLYFRAQETFIEKWGRLPEGLRRMSAEECGV